MSTGSGINKEEMKNALVLGTGGSSRAVCYVLGKMGLNVKIVSRSRNANTITYSDIDAVLMNSTRLIINTTPLGMYPNIETFPEIDYNLLTSSHILFDLVYNPEITAFLRKGSENGCTIVSGLKMLHSQAEKSWEIWNDKSL
jgi:shikimate dehydrogenase